MRIHRILPVLPYTARDLSRDPLYAFPLSLTSRIPVRHMHDALLLSGPMRKRLPGRFSKALNTRISHVFREARELC